MDTCIALVCLYQSDCCSRLSSPAQQEFLTSWLLQEPRVLATLQKLHGGKRVRDVHMTFAELERQSRLVYVPGYLIDYVYGAVQDDSLVITKQNHQALVPAAGAHKASQFRSHAPGSGAGVRSVSHCSWCSPAHGVCSSSCSLCMYNTSAHGNDSMQRYWTNTVVRR